MGKTLTFLSLAALVASAKAAAVDLTEADFDQQVLESGKVRAREFLELDFESAWIIFYFKSTVEFDFFFNPISIFGEFLCARACIVRLVTVLKSLSLTQYRALS